MNKRTAALRQHSLLCCLWLLGILSVAGNAAQAANLKGGDIMVVDAIGGTNGAGALFKVDPVSGQRSILSDFGNSAQGPLGSGDLTGVAVRRNGRMYVSALFSGSGGNGALLKVDTESGNRTLIKSAARLLSDAGASCGEQRLTPLPEPPVRSASLLEQRGFEPAVRFQVKREKFKSAPSVRISPAPAARHC